MKPNPKSLNSLNPTELRALIARLHGAKIYIKDGKEHFPLVAPDLHIMLMDCMHEVDELPANSRPTFRGVSDWTNDLNDAFSLIYEMTAYNPLKIFESDRRLVYSTNLEINLADGWSFTIELEDGCYTITTGSTPQMAICRGWVLWKQHNEPDDTTFAQPDFMPNHSTANTPSAVLDVIANVNEMIKGYIQLHSGDLTEDFFGLLSEVQDELQRVKA